MVATLFFFQINISIQAQNSKINATDCACCEAHYKDFDFWEGQWVVKDTLGNKVGENSIKKIESNCILQESWKGQKGGTGTSINYFNKIDSTWNQTWVSGTGNVLVLKGNLDGDKMVLKSELIQNKRGLYYNQITWIPNADGTVTQIWEIFAEDGTKQKSVFKGIYHRKK
jgi:hypothetical protein